MRTFYSKKIYSGGHELGTVTEDYLRGAYDALKDLDEAYADSFDEWIDNFIKDGDLVEKEPVKTWAWIPVEERLPNDDWCVLVSCETAEGDPIVCIGEYDSESKIWDIYDPNLCSAHYEVKAWMENLESYGCYK